eukprot:2720613-Amphidinium_carterae.2
MSSHAASVPDAAESSAGGSQHCGSGGLLDLYPMHRRALEEQSPVAQAKVEDIYSGRTVAA